MNQAIDEELLREKREAETLVRVGLQVQKTVAPKEAGTRPQVPKPQFTMDDEDDADFAD